MSTMWGPDAILIYNDAYAKLVGRLHPHCLGKSAPVALPHAASLLKAVLARVHAGETVILREQRLVSTRHGDPEEIWFDLCYTPILDADGRIDGAQAIVTETTNEVREREDVESALRQSQKMEAVGQLTGGISHDFNNLLTGIMGNLDMLATRMAQGEIESAQSYLEGARSAATRAAGLTHRLLTFSRRQDLSPDTIPVAALLDDMHELIDRTVGPSIEVRVRRDAGIWDGFCDRNQLENALLNLAINARDAMPDGGLLVLEADNATLGEPGRTQSHLPGDYVVLAITDSGHGMSQDVVDRAFDPFFTTKPDGQGTGLGLSMVYGFIKQSGGHIEIASRPGLGTTIRLYIPRARGTADDERQDDAPDRHAPPGNAQAGARILVVDDEPDLRALLADMLVEQGFSVLEAQDAACGLDIIRSDARIDLLIADIGLPGSMNGIRFAEAARAQRSVLPVLFVTGLTDGDGSETVDEDDKTATLHKPFSFATLHAQVSRLLDAASR